jgi:uncharacterized membrane protein
MTKIPDIIQLNDWEPKKFLGMMVAIQLAMFGAIGLDFMGFEIPILRQVIGFIYLTFVPGIIILRFLKIHRLGVSQTILFSAGLSITFLMFSGFFLNLILSFLNIASPLSFRHVVVFITILLIILFILSYRIDKSYHNEPSPLIISRSALSLMLLPALSIVGTYIVNFNKNNILLLILIVLIALIPVLVAFRKIPSELYPVAVVVIALSLLFHSSLISMYLTGWDINAEYYVHELVVDSGYWNSNMYSNVNAMLSIVILPAVYSYFLKMDGTWIFKIIYPVIFSLVPLGLYCIYRNQIKSEMMAFFSVFFFMSFVTFFTEMLSLGRQEIAELFFVLLLFLMVQGSIKGITRNILLLIFGASLVTSHYGLSYIYIIFILIIFIFSLNFIIPSKIKLLTLPEFSLKRLTIKYFVAFYIVFAFLWYMNVSGSSAFKSIVEIGDHIYTNIFGEFFNLENRDTSLLLALGIKDTVVPSVGREVYRALQFITEFFIIIGFFKIIIYRESAKLKAEYFYLVVASLLIILLSVLPNFAKSFNMTRIYHIALLSLSPLCIIGGTFVFAKLAKIIKIKPDSKQYIAILILVMGVLVPYFLFSTGFVYEMTKDSPISIPLGMERMSTDNITKVGFYNTYTPEQDVYSSKWFSENKDVNKTIYADRDSKLNVLNSYGMTPQFKVNSPFKDGKLYEVGIPHSYYVYLRRFNVCDDTYVESSLLIFNISSISPLINKTSNIYSNGCGDIYIK